MAERAAVPRLRQQQKEFTRARLSEAALELFESQGYAATTVDEIAQAAGTSRATFYTHFKGKEDVVEALVEALWEAARVTLDKLNGLPSWSRANLRRWLDEDTEWWPGNAAASRIIRQAAPGPQPRYREHMDRLVAATVEGNPRWRRLSGDPYLRARLLLVQVQAFYSQWTVWGWSAGRAAELDILAEACWATLHAAKPAP